MLEEVPWEKKGQRLISYVKCCLYYLLLLGKGHQDDQKDRNEQFPNSHNKQMLLKLKELGVHKKILFI